MDFSVAAPAGVPVAAVILLRGADPLVTIPPGHPYPQLRPGANYVVPPGALAGQALPFSTLQGTLGVDDCCTSSPTSVFKEKWPGESSVLACGRLL